MAISAPEAREKLAGRTIWLWHYLHADWQWEQSRHWHEDRYALAVGEALDLMQRDPEFCYYFDTASEFFSAVAQRLEPRMEELKEHVRNGRIRVVSAHLGSAADWPDAAGALDCCLCREGMAAWLTLCSMACK